MPEHAVGKSPLIHLLLAVNPGPGADTIGRELGQIHPGYIVTQANSYAELVKTLKEDIYDACFLELTLPGASELSALHAVAEKNTLTAIIILADNEDEALARKAVAKGAQDYLLKQHVCAASLRRAMDFAIERKWYETGAQHAYADPLTGLSRRSVFESRLERALARANRQAIGLSVFLVDLDGMQEISQRASYEASDQLLRETADRLRSIFRSYDTVARFSGNTFAVLLEGSDTPRDCARIAHKVERSLSAPFPADGQAVSANISIGIAIAHDNGSYTAQVLVENAYAAMRAAKCDTDCSYRFYTADLQNQLTAKLTLEQELRLALEQETLLLYYQPRMDGATQQIIGVEAMPCWHHPVQGMLKLGDFLPIAEEAGLLIALERWMLATICRDLHAWKSIRNQPFQVAVNLSWRQLEAFDFIPWLAELIENSLISPEWLALEFTEAAIMHNPASALPTLERIRALGVHIHLDDFGKDEASMRLLYRTKPDLLKIDAGLIRTMNEAQEVDTMIRFLITLSHQMHFKAGALGVETEWQKNQLISYGCNELQGELISRPHMADEIISLVS